MRAIEFKSKVKDGIIVIPEKFRGRIHENVKVILLSEDPEDATSDMIERLLESPIHLPDFRPFRREEIYERG